MCLARKSRFLVYTPATRNLAFLIGTGAESFFACGRRSLPVLVFIVFIFVEVIIIFIGGVAVLVAQWTERKI